MKLRWIVIHDMEVVQFITSNNADSYFKIYDWAVEKWNGDMFAIVPFDDDHVQTMEFD